MKFAFSARPSNTRALLVAFPLLLLSAAAMAGTSGAEFKDFYDLMVAWNTGYLGKGLALAAFLMGAVVGMVKGTMIPALVGIGFAIMFTVGPNVITGMLAAIV